MEFKFGTQRIIELSEVITQKLRESGIFNQAELTIYVDKDNFKKIDEDLFYRNKQDDDAVFSPSEGEIDITFDMLSIKVKEG